MAGRMRFCFPPIRIQTPTPISHLFVFNLQSPYKRGPDYRYSALVASLRRSISSLLLTARFLLYCSISSPRCFLVLFIHLALLTSSQDIIVVAVFVIL
ncbi:unnamed protein product [Lactuca virosa]|uniref:Uncharacterized protein n=1 Tax=Lactuca virosa TaxID=75947 RepID=A0AAU9MVA1_9ASTR|nr:unnamed protein product [Lactuca virosa]